MEERPRGFWKRLAESGFYRGMGRVHAGFYRLSCGRLGHRTGRLEHLLLTTTGRRSGRARTVPLTYLRDGESWVLIASNGGADRHAGWWLNLRADPRGRIQIGAYAIDVLARAATAEERARLWPRVLDMNAVYARYERLTRRAIPIVILEPIRR